MAGSVEELGEVTQEVFERRDRIRREAIESRVAVLLSEMREGVAAAAFASAGARGPGDAEHGRGRSDRPNGTSSPARCGGASSQPSPATGRGQP
jgi:hypothetical protein